MKFSGPNILLASAIPFAGALPRPAPLVNPSPSYITADLYASPDPSFAGAPIVLTAESQPPATTAAGPGRYAISYTPYTHDLRCKSPTDVAADVARIAAAGFEAVRVYDTDCDSVRRVGAAAVKHNLKIVLGIHIGEGGLGEAGWESALQEMVDYIAEGQEHMAALDMVVVGNEAVFNEYVTVDEVVGVMAVVRGTLRRAGWRGPITTAEPFGTIVQNSEALCPAVDVVVADLLPFFHVGVSASTAGTFAVQQIAKLENLCARDDDMEESEDSDDATDSSSSEAAGKGKPVMAMEVGWPSRGKDNGDAWPGRLEQRVALASIANAIGSRAVFNSFQDEVWREPGDLGVETHWGSIEVFET